MFRVFEFVVTFFAADERENFIALHRFNFHVSDLFIQQSRGLLPRHFQNAQNGFLPQTSETRNGTDAHAFAEQLNRLHDFFHRHAQSVQWRFFCKWFSAMQTFESLHRKVSISIKSTSFNMFRLATVTVHLTFLGQDLQWFCIIQIPLKASAFGCALPVLRTTSRAFVYVSLFSLTLCISFSTLLST